MKRQNLTFAKGKSTLLLMFLAAGISFGVTSCSKDDKDEATPGVTNENAAVMVSQSVTSQGGLVTQIEASTLTVSALEARKAEGGRLSDFCGKTEKDTVAFSGNGNGTSFSYALYWSYGLQCLQDIPSAFNFEANGTISLGMEKFSSSSTYASQYTLRGLGANSANWEISQKYDATGKLESKTTDMPSYTSEIHYESTDIKVSKTTHMIVSGTATAKISGKDSKGNAFSYSGMITFKGNKKATYVISGGGTFELQW
ncbi:hypothetical protein [Chitinophaga agri]|uniref:Lipoprotein n=1 Tax=Chitinophaga agri TaxID=2703787 RepID=A0A6B9ZE64_9BACT|nr:hypothetical protein [Chitinophaga agri]QHS59791.1 hypothetical protein GWR21_09360 [Chitinophaga agri]